MKVSVIIPVYNAAEFVRQAVESALSQPETEEVVLVEDGSPDDSLAVCQALAVEYPKVKLYRHANGENRGAGETRSFAILKSTCEYIAFLDADDYYLPGRFITAKALFEADAELEGVYEAIGMHIENDKGAQRWEVAGRKRDRLDTLTQRVPPEQLLTTLVQGKNGGFSIDGLVVKRSVFDKTGLFDAHLRLHQDTAMIYKIAAVARLLPGRLDEPVAMWRVHDHNRISAPRPKSEIYKAKLVFWYTLWRWGTENLDIKDQQLFLDALLNAADFLPRFNRPFPRRLRGLQKRVQLALLLRDYPLVAREAVYWKRFIPGIRRRREVT